MAQLTELRPTDFEYTIAKICDRCLVRADVESNSLSVEFNEFLTIQWEAGYGSLLKDGATYRIDLCQRCVKEYLAPFSRIVSNGPFSADHSAVMAKLFNPTPETVRLKDVWIKAVKALGGHAKARTWLITHSETLGTTPMRMLGRSGLLKLLDELSRIESTRSKM